MVVVNNMRFLGKTVWIFLFTLLNLAAVPVLAADGKIGFVNATRIMNEIPQADQIRKNIKDEFAPRDNKIVKMQAELKKLEEKLAKSADIMTAASRTTSEKKVFTLKRDIKRAREEFTEDLNIRRNEELGKLQKLVYQAIISFAKQNDYDMILGDTVLYSSRRVDVTDNVIARLKQEHKQITAP